MTRRRTIRVMHSVKLLSAGGVERRRFILFERLRTPAFEHLLVCTEVTDEWARARAQELGVDVVETGPVNSVLSPRRYVTATRLARKWRPDIIHGAIIEGYTLAVVAGRMARVPAIILEETSDPQNRSGKANLLVRGLARGATQCIAVSRGVDAYLAELGIPQRKRVVIHNGVVPPRMVPDAERRELRIRWGIGADALVVGTVSRLDDGVKRITDLVKAVAQLRNVVGLRLLIVGEGPDRGLIEAEARTLNVLEQLVFAGHQTDVAPWYAAMDVFALASDSEAFGLVNVEAMFAGLPVVATAVGGIPEVVEDGVTGVLVPPRRPTALAIALDLLLQDPERRQAMGQRGRSRAQEHFSDERYAQQVGALYRELVR